MNNIITISGIRGYVDKNGVAQLNAEDVARGWGFTQVAKSGNVVVRWERMNKYLNEFGFIPTSGDGIGTNDFIPENMVYRLGFKASNEAAQKFQTLLADEVLPALRKTGTYTIPKDKSPNLKQQEVEARLRNARVREANILYKLADKYPNNPEYRGMLYSKAAQAVTGEMIIPLPTQERKTYSARDIGDMFGVSKQAIGKIANTNGLKTAEYGRLFVDKSPHSVKEVETWRYYDTAIPVFAKLLGKEVVA